MNARTLITTMLIFGLLGVDAAVAKGPVEAGYGPGYGELPTNLRAGLTGGSFNFVPPHPSEYRSEFVNIGEDEQADELEQDQDEQALDEMGRLFPKEDEAELLHAQVTCSGYQCDNQDPMATGCNSGAQTVDTRDIYFGSQKLGYVDLRWSPTCGTNWTRITRTYGSTSGWMHAILTRTNDGHYQDTWGQGSSFWTPMLYGQNLCTYSQGYIYYGNPTSSPVGYAKTKTVC